MSVFPTNFEGIFLKFLWLGSLVLAGLSVVLAIALIVLRALRETKQKALSRRKEEIKKTMTACLHAFSETASNVSDIFDLRDFGLALSVAVDWLRPLSGQQAEKLVLMLRSFGSAAYINKTLLRGTKSRKIEALIYCAHETTDETLEHLVRHSFSDDPAVQLICLRGIALRKETAALQEVLLNPKTLRVTSVVMLADVFSKLGAENASFLVSLAKSSSASLEMRMAAVTALGFMGASESVPSLMDLFDEAALDANVKARIIATLGRLGDARAEKAVLKGLYAEDIGVRVNAVNAAARLRGIAFLPRLFELLDDPVWWVRFRAGQTLAVMGKAGRAALAQACEKQGNKGSLARAILAEYKEDIP